MLQLYTSSSKLSDENTSSDETSDSETFMAPHVLAMSATPIPRTFSLFGWLVRIVAGSFMREKYC